MPTFAVPSSIDSSLSVEKRIENLENTFMEFLSRMSWFTSKLDSKNVKRLDTNETVIRSKDGETRINGPVLEQYDKQAVPVLRLKQGYDSVTGDFLYAMYNKAGVQTVGIDSNGNATFTGSIDASAITGTTITGGTIRTAATGDRIELSNSRFRGLNSLNQVNGLYLYVTTGISDIYLFHNDVPLVTVIDNTNEYIITGTSSATRFGLGGTACPTYCYGTWNFTSATILGLSAASAGLHNHGVPTGTVLMVSGGGTVTFSESGAHTHTVE